MSDEAPSAQGNLPETTDTAASQPPADTSGVQARINELTARYHESERRSAAQQDQLMQLTAELVRARNPVVPQVDPIVASIDPGDRDKFAAMFKHYAAEITGPLERRVAQLQGSLQQTRASSVLGSIDNPEIKQEAERLISGWRNAGLLGSVTTEEDAVLMAKGKFYDKAQSKKERTGFNDSESPLSGVRAAPTNSGKKRRFDVGSMSQEDILANMNEIEKEMGDVEF